MVTLYLPGAMFDEAFTVRLNRLSLAVSLTLKVSLDIEAVIPSGLEAVTLTWALNPFVVSFTLVVDEEPASRVTGLS